jgi:hypothetical protein
VTHCNSGERSVADEVNKGSNSRLKQIIFGAVIIGTAAFTTIFLVLNVYLLWIDNKLVMKIIEEHYAATMGLPLAAIAALVLVLLLEASAGPIEIEGLGFKFRGASGPAILWIFVFLAMTLAIKLLW